MLPPELDVKKISQFTLINNELNAKVLYTFQKPIQYYYWDNGVGCASVEFCEGLYIEYIEQQTHRKVSCHTAILHNISLSH